MPRKDGCPRCLRRDNEPRTWDETTGKATYRCACGHAWATWWEHTASTGPELLADFSDEFIASITNPERNPNV